jgi:hypothetical protein
MNNEPDTPLFPEESDENDDDMSKWPGFIRYATVDDFDEADDCPMCAYEREQVRNGAKVGLFDWTSGEEEEDEPLDEVLH